MASVLALLDEVAFKKHAKQFAPGAVLPIASYQTDDRSFATELSHGGALYLAVSDGDALSLVAVLEAPETSGIKKADKRKPGWYAPPNGTPVTDLSPLRKSLKIGKDLAKAFERPRILTAAQDAALRELLDAVDSPVLGHVDDVVVAPTLSSKLPPLERAATYLDGGHLEAAIDAIAESWRGSRAGELADLIDRVTRLMPASHRPLFERRSTHTSDVWDAAFDANPATMMPQLLLNLAVGGSSLISKRAKRLGELPLDPRFGARLIELLPQYPVSADARWFPPLTALWLASKDARTFESLREVLERESVGVVETRLRALASGTAPTLPVADRARVDKLVTVLERLEEPLRIERALIDQIAANPDEDGPYLVYADWLIERGRPLGDYITLTVQHEHLTPAQARRRALLAEVPYLCGAFDDMATSRMRKRERGLDRELKVSWSTQLRSWRVFAASPLTRVLERVTLVGNPHAGREAVLAEFLCAAPALRRFENLTLDTATEIARRVDGWRVKRTDVIAITDELAELQGADLIR